MEPEDNALSDDDLPSSVPDFVRTYISCSICHCMQTEWRDLSPSCPHSICKCCLDRWDQKIPKHCPECRMEFTMESVRPSVKLNSFAAHVTVRCVKVGRRNGCSWEGTYESRAGHKRECEFQPLPCPHEGEGCPEHPLRKDVQSHAASCPYRLLPCCHPGCSRQFQARHEGDKVAHEEDCEFRPVSCDFCGESEVQRQLANHLENCPKAMVSCPSEALEEVAKTVTSGVPKDDVRAQDVDKHCLVCANCRSKHQDGFSVVDLHAAASSCLLDCVKCILTTSESLLREVDTNGRTVLHVGASGCEGCLNIVKYLVEEKGCS
eukprot:Rmarinus@m.6828